jgi:hypothetical protein
LGKAELEAIRAVFGGIPFGWLAWRRRSFVYPFLIRWFIHAQAVVVAHG